eukprot:CAMPEP_0195523868 /NCGR_PEP_ID=MMETSP0794_2-20130614/23339_1 /TAXON_ID=515487 /ORGANISM="Stephanopyxis turris, Strain CCMP 815" /LENGTH=171 /DNA_ID=CAMNT_0040653957 /DNA_START=61 /DNA_END=573 /DNA_ORIENTATION=-
MTKENDYFGYIGDLTQAGTQKLGRITAEVNELVGHLREAVKSVKPNGRVIHIAHSQGALITSLAAKQLTPDELSRIEVITFGGAAALTSTDYPHFHRLVNYYSTNDPLLLLVPSAARALQTGFIGSGINYGDGNKKRKEEEAEFVFLTPRVGNPVLDHGLFNPTYGEALLW